MPYGAGTQFAHRNRSVSADRFAMVPRADIPRSVFVTDFTHKTTFDADFLIPVYVDEVLPGDSFSVRATMFARLSTPLFPIMDNLHLDSFFFFCPCRLVWDNWEQFMGERKPNPESSIDYVIPKLAPFSGAASGTVFDYFGLPHSTFVTTPMTNISALPFRVYNLIYNEWFRDENLIASFQVPTGLGPDALSNFNLAPRGKRHDYFTSALPWPQKGDAVSLPLGTLAPVKGIGFLDNATVTTGPDAFRETGGDSVSYPFYVAGAGVATGDVAFMADDISPATPGIYADLSEASAATINMLRLAFQTQRLLERDARGGTRYTEILRSHFGVLPQDARLQRPEYLGGGRSSVVINPVVQNSATGIEGGDSPLGALGAVGTALSQHGFSQSFTEHGYIIGLVSVRADLTYQQGLHRMWTRNTRYDFFWPVFSHLGEQAILSREIYATGEPEDGDVFGYQERWAEYRYRPSLITGMFRSGISGTLDAWHLSQFFGTRPTLGGAFVLNNTPMARILAAGDLASGQEFLFDSVWSRRVTRAMPAYSVPGFVDRF